MNILICNVGSTSLKYQLFDMDAGEQVLAAGGAERVGQAKSLFYHKNNKTDPRCPNLPCGAGDIDLLGVLRFQLGIFDTLIFHSSSPQLIG